MRVRVQDWSVLENLDFVLDAAKVKPLHRHTVKTHLETVLEQRRVSACGTSKKRPADRSDAHLSRPTKRQTPAPVPPPAPPAPATSVQWLPSRSRTPPLAAAQVDILRHTMDRRAVLLQYPTFNDDADVILVRRAVETLDDKPRRRLAKLAAEGAPAFMLAVAAGRLGRPGTVLALPIAAAMAVQGGGSGGYSGSDSPPLIQWVDLRLSPEKLFSTAAASMPELCRYATGDLPSGAFAIRLFLTSKGAFVEVTALHTAFDSVGDGMAQDARHGLFSPNRKRARSRLLNWLSPELARDRSNVAAVTTEHVLELMSQEKALVANGITDDELRSRLRGSNLLRKGTRPMSHQLAGCRWLVQQEQHTDSV